MRIVNNFLLGLLTTCAAAETNVVTITNKAGRVYESVRIIENVGDGLLYLGSNGVSGGKIKFSDLAPEVAQRLGYNYLSEAIAQDRERLERQRREAVARAAADAAARKQQIERVQATRMVIKGKIIQKIRGVLLVDSMSQDRSLITTPFQRAHYGFQKTTAVETKDGQIYNGWCILVGYQGQDRVVDGDIVETVGFPDGQYSYKTVGGSEKTVRRFQVDPLQVHQLADAATMAEIRREVER